MIDKRKYLVLDVETNGLNSQKNDLLSLTIYDPESNELYNKFFPLDLDYDVYTTHFNGITVKTLNGATRLTQKEVDELIEKFNIKNRTILIYGSLDKPFLTAYFKRRGLKNINSFSFFNFKKLIFSSSYNLENNVTKDNLCKIFNIDGVKAVHSGINDCILQWKLFEKINNEPLIVIDNSVYKFNKNYIIPASYLSYYKRLESSLTHLPHLACKTKLIKAAPLHNDIKRFSGNTSGIAIEAKIRAFFNAKRINSLDFLNQNLSAMEYLGSLPTTQESIPVTTKSDGSLLAINKSDRELIKEINFSYETLTEDTKELLLYIKEKIFNCSSVYSQELIINKKDNILALCDLSNEHGVVEIKTGNNITVNDFKYQLFYQSNNRPCYLLTVDWSNYTLNLFNVEFVFNHEADIEIKSSKILKLENEVRDLQKHFFDDKNLEITEYKGKSCNSRFRCKICNSSFEMKLNITSEVIHYFLNCPFCNPSTAPNRYEKFSNFDFYRKIKGNLGKRRIDIYNWITKNEIYLKCRKCSNIWKETMKSLEHCTCPICSKKDNV